MKYKRVISSVITAKSDTSNKGDYGRAAIIAGSKDFPGALQLSASAALKSGVGYIDILYQDKRPDYLISTCPEVTYRSLGDIKDVLEYNRYTSILFGPGLSFSSKEYSKTFDSLLKNYSGRLIIDGSGFIYLKDFYLKNQESLIKPELILLPHLKEFTFLVDTNLVSSDPLDYRNEAEQFLLEHPRTCLVVKSYKTLFLTNVCSYLLDLPTPGLAKAGSGDALAGFLTGLFAYQKAHNIDIARAGNLIFLLAAKEATKQKSTLATTASDVIASLPKILAKYE